MQALEFCFLSSTAVIKIKLKNCGKDAFKPKEYGLHIIVERKISSDGAGTYKLCNEKGNYRFETIFKWVAQLESLGRFLGNCFTGAFELIQCINEQHYCCNSDLY